MSQCKYLVITKNDFETILIYIPNFISQNTNIYKSGMWKGKKKPQKMQNLYLQKWDVENEKETSENAKFIHFDSDRCKGGHPI